MECKKCYGSEKKCRGVKPNEEMQWIRSIGDVRLRLGLGWMLAFGC